MQYHYRDSNFTIAIIEKSTLLLNPSQKHPYAVTSGNKVQITILACASASKYSTPPMTIFNHRQLQPEVAEVGMPGTFYGLTDNG